MVMHGSYRTVGNFCMVQTFAIFVDRSTTVKFLMLNSACYSANKQMVGVVSQERWHEI